MRDLVLIGGYGGSGSRVTARIVYGMGYEQPPRVNTSLDDLELNTLLLSGGDAVGYLESLPAGTAVKLAGRTLALCSGVGGDCVYVHCMRDPRAILARVRDATNERLGPDVGVKARYLDWILFNIRAGEVRGSMPSIDMRFEDLHHGSGGYTDRLAAFLGADPIGPVGLDLKRAFDCPRVEPPTDWLAGMVAAYGY